MSIKARAGRWFAARGREPSTWVGIVALLCTITGWQLDLEEREAITGVLGSLTAAYLVFTREQKKIDSDPDSKRP